MKKTALIDADIISYLGAYHSMQKFDDGEVWVDMETAKADVRATIQEWTEGAGCEEALLVFSPADRTNFRTIVWPEYKTHRKSGSKPPHLSEVAAHMTEAYDSIVIPYLEGDDVLGILHTRDPEATVMVSTDKDMGTIPGYWYNPNKHFGLGPVETTQAEATAWLYTQVMTGDSTDGYKGITRCGPVKAKKFLELHHGCALVDGMPTYHTDGQGLHEEVLQAYLENKQTAADFVTNLSMARILTDSLYDESYRNVLLPTNSWGINEPLQLPE